MQPEMEDTLVSRNFGDPYKEALEKAISVAPSSFDMHIRQRPPWFRPEDHAHIVEGLRKAGWQD